MIKEYDNHELLDLKTRIRLTKNECLQHYLSTLKIKRLKKLVQPLTREEIEKLPNEKTYQNSLNLKNTFYIRQPLEDKLFQINPIASRIFGRKNIQWKDTSISEQSEKYKELRGKVNNIFDKPSKEGILKIFKQDPYTSKLISTHEQPLTKYKKFTDLSFNKSDKFTNISPFNEPLFNQLTLIVHLEENLYIRIATNKKLQLTEGQYQDWQQQ
ncbi:44926_t:CDS:1, partial [Gigaspora margarita]